MNEPVFACPHCALTLADDATGARCATGHTFDRAREGYLNLLIGGRLGSQDPRGDSSDALAARRRFLAAGHYRPVAALLAEVLGDPGGPILDVGCGEGYYLSTLDVDAMSNTQRCGIDISKAAVRMAARTIPNGRFAVASAYRLPIPDASVAAVLSVFGPRPFDEFQRVLRPGGYWVAVTPAADHLRELRPPMSAEARRKSEERARRRSSAPSEAVSARRLTFTLDLDEQSADDLLHMTPIRWQHDGHAAATTAVRAVIVDVWVSSSR
jgi:23S rRNA (guanine745-N1)-methyltransferase